MIVCKKCGHQNNDTDEWCTNPACGAYLAFDGSVAAPTPAKDPGSGAAVPPPATPVAPAVIPAPVPPATARPAPAPPPESPAIPPIRPGERVCPRCLWGNDPGRSFCRHCGGQLTNVDGADTGPVAAPPGPRPRRRWPLVVAGVVLAVVCAGVGAIAVGAYDRRATPATGTAGPRPSPTTEAGSALRKTDYSVRASTSEPGAGPQFLSDGDPHSYWAALPGANGATGNTRLTVSIPNAAHGRIVRMEVMSGGIDDQYRRRPRPASICLHLDGGECIPRQLLDQPDAQEIRVDATKPVGQLDVDILTVYPAQTADYTDNRVALRELTLFAAP